MYSIVLWIKDKVSPIFNHLPRGGYKLWLRNYIYNFLYIYPLKRVIVKTKFLSDGICFVEFADGTKFYGEQDKLLSAQRISHAAKVNNIIKEYNAFFEMLGCIYLKGIYEKHTKLKEGDIIVDIGANIGVFTVKAAKIVGSKGRIIAIEPEIKNLKLLKRNVEINNLDNVVTVNKGIWKTRSRMKLDVSQNPTNYTLFRQTCIETKNVNNLEEIEVDTLDNILAEIGINNVDFIKMDIEGAEIDALKGMNKIIQASDVSFAGEWHIVNGKSTYKLLAKELRQKGHECQKEGNLFFAKKLR